MGMTREHKALIGPGKFRPKCNQPAGWPDADWERLLKYGLWYEALVEGTILPTTEKQQRFVDFFRNREDREPEPPHESVWKAYCGRVQWSERPAKAFAQTPKIPKPKPTSSSRLENGDDDTVYFHRRRKR